MKITSFNPVIAAQDPESIIKLFEELGFEVRHRKKDFEMEGTVAVHMQDANGFHLDVCSSPEPKAEMSLRINVDDFDEAYEYFMERGFTNVIEGRIGKKYLESPSSLNTYLVSPSGFIIALVKHIKDHK